jgi:hypothetical protein
VLCRAARQTRLVTQHVAFALRPCAMRRALRIMSARWNRSRCQRARCARTAGPVDDRVAPVLRARSSKRSSRTTTRAQALGDALELTTCVLSAGRLSRRVRPKEASTRREKKKKKEDCIALTRRPSFSTSATLHELSPHLGHAQQPLSPPPAPPPAAPSRASSMPTAQPLVARVHAHDKQSSVSASASARARLRCDLSRLRLSKT